jgi:nitrite reductase (NO-forming)
MKMKKLALLLAVLVVSLTVVACGGGGGEAPAPVSLSFDGLDAFAYEPPSATVPTGSQVTVNFNNVGALEHDWMLAEEGIDLAAVTAEDALDPAAHSGVLPAGESNTFTFTAPAAGTYQIVCTVPGHALGGMVGTFTVTE